MSNQSAGKKVLRITGKVISWIFLAVLIVAQIFPFYLKLVESVQPFSHIIIQGELPLWPDAFQLSNYAKAWVDADLSTGFMNSCIITFSMVAISSVVVLLMGYVLAKKNFRGKKVVFLMLLATMMVPGEINMIPNYRLVAEIGLIDTRFGVIAPGLVNIFGVLLVKQFMESLPDSTLESADIDGANEFVKIFRIVLPMSLSVISTYVILTFVSSWNEYIWPNLVLNSDWLYTIQLKLMYFQLWTGASEEYILRSAALISTVLPVVIVYFIFQRQFIEGMSISGLK